MQSVSLGNSLHEMSNPIFWKKLEKYFKLSSAEFAQRVVSDKVLWKIAAVDILTFFVIFQTHTKIR